MELDGAVDLGNACAGLPEDALKELRAIALLCLEGKGLVVTTAGWIAETAESILPDLPKDWNGRVEKATELALKAAYDAAASTQAEEGSETILNRVLSWASGERVHQVMAGVSGAIGGSGGVATALAELPASVALIFRAIQEIAVKHGFDLNDPEVRKQCLVVFSLGGPNSDDDEADVGFLAARVALSGKNAMGLIAKMAPDVAAFLSQKLLAKAVPVVGGLTGAVINPSFMQYYQAMAHVHFRLRKVEEQHEPEQVKACFERVLRAERARKK